MEYIMQSNNWLKLHSLTTADQIVPNPTSLLSNLSVEFISILMIHHFYFFRLISRSANQRFHDPYFVKKTGKAFRIPPWRRYEQTKHTKIGDRRIKNECWAPMNNVISKVWIGMRFLTLDNPWFDQVALMLEEFQKPFAYFPLSPFCKNFDGLFVIVNNCTQFLDHLEKGVDRRWVMTGE